MNRRPGSKSLLAALLTLSLGSGADAKETPLAVSPGRGADLTLIEQRCPTFSWSHVPGAKGYELVVYQLSEDAEASAQVLAETVDGLAQSWTPSLDRCLDRGERFAWSVRAKLSGEPQEWSEPKFFKVAAAPSLDELESALRTVTEYLETRSGPEPSESENALANAAEVVSSTSDPGAGMATGSPGRPEPDLAVTTRPDPVARLGAQPGMISLVTDGAVGVGTTPVADLHVVGGPALTSLLVAPGEPTSGENSQIMLAEDDDGTFGVKLKYDGATNFLQFWGHTTAGDKGPWLEIDRDFGQIRAERWNPDGPCFNSTERFVACGNGTVTDTFTGLIYLADANCFGEQDWPTANTSAAELEHGDCGLTDGSRRGDWRLPTNDEWEQLVDPNCATPPKIAGNGLTIGSCYSDEPWASSVQPDRYWSSRTYADSVRTYGNAWLASLALGSVGHSGKSNLRFVWPVRSVD